MRAWVIFAGVLALVFAVGVPAKIYKWVDDQGQTHYGQQPPSGVDAEPVSVHAAPASGGSGNAAAPASGADANGEQETAAGDAQADDTVSQNCRIAQQNLSILESAGPDGNYRGPDGEDVTYSEEEWQRRVDQSKGYIEGFCQED